MKPCKKFARLALPLLLTACLLAGCGAGGSASSAQSTSGAGGQTPVEADFSYPMDHKDVTLEIYAEIEISKASASMNENPFQRDLGEMVGVNLVWNEPPAGSDRAAYYNMLIASEDLPDILFCGKVVTDSSVYLTDNVIIDLTELLPKYAPQYMSFITGYEGAEKAIRTDDGKYYAFFACREKCDPPGFTKIWRGPAVRKDLLDQMSLAKPLLVSDWDNVLAKLKENYNMTLSTVYGWEPQFIVGAYGATRDYFIDDEHKVNYGPVTQAYKQGMEKLHEWWEKGYIDQDYASMDDPTLRQKILNDEIGATVTTGSRINGYMGEIAALGSTAVWEAAQWPVLAAGDQVKFAQHEWPVQAVAAAITSACENPEIACRVLDYGYGGEGFVYWNFGKEGASFNYVDGKPVFTDAVLKAADPVTESTKYVGTRGSGFAIQAASYVEQTTGPIGITAFKTWAIDNIADQYIMPAISPTYEESSEINSMVTAIKTYVDEMYFKFLMGQESLDNFDEYVKQVESMGLARVLEVKQAQVDRYFAR